MHYARRKEKMPDADTTNLAFEEGLAIRMQIKAKELLDETFPGGSKLRQEVITTLKQTGYIPKKEKDDYINIILFKEEETSGKFAVNWGKAASGSVELVDYLVENIPDFDKLVERARLKHETLALARAIEKRFGEGSYSKIVQAREFEAEDLPNELKAKQPPNF